jgi:hypothetical protein
MTTQETSEGHIGSSALFGVLEWISLQGGTFNAFNPGLITGKVRGLTYRYFIAEGWIGLKTPDCTAGKATECLNIEDFRYALEIHAPNAAAQDMPHFLPNDLAHTQKGRERGPDKTQA